MSHHKIQELNLASIGMSLTVNTPVRKHPTATVTSDVTDFKPPQANNVTLRSSKLELKVVCLIF